MTAQEKHYLSLIMDQEKLKFTRHYNDAYIVAPLNNKTLMIGKDERT